VLIDSGASENSVDKTIAERLALPLSGESAPIAMASSEVTVEMFGKARGMLNLLDRSYPDVAFSVINNLCADVIVGQEFLKQHSSVTFEMQGPERAIVIPGSTSDLPGQLAVATAKLDPSRLFEYLLPQCKSIASRSRRYNQEDTLFINNEIKRLLEADIIKPARSPWRAQVLVVNQPRKKEKDSCRLFCDCKSFHTAGRVPLDQHRRSRE